MPYDEIRERMRTTVMTWVYSRKCSVKKPAQLHPHRRILFHWWTQHAESHWQMSLIMKEFSVIFTMGSELLHITDCKREPYLKDFSSLWSLLLMLKRGADARHTTLDTDRCPLTICLLHILTKSLHWSMSCPWTCPVVALLMFCVSIIF